MGIVWYNLPLDTF